MYEPLELKASKLTASALSQCFDTIFFVVACSDRFEIRTYDDIDDCNDICAVVCSYFGGEAVII